MLTRHNYLWYLQEVTMTRAMQKKAKNQKKILKKKTSKL